MKMIALYFFLLPIVICSNLDYLDIGLEFTKITDVYYWTNDVTIQLIYQIPLPPSVEEFSKSRCEYAISARRSLYDRFRRQFTRIAKLSLYTTNCSRFENPEQFQFDTEAHCMMCFHISSENDPYYLECLTLLELRHLCKRREKRNTHDSYVLSNIAVMLAENAKTQDDRITSKFHHEHNLQKENVNFQLLFLNTFRWQMSLSELWLIRYIQGEPETFARILVNLSGILPKTRMLTEQKINASLSENWKFESMNRNSTHVSINVSFTSYNKDYRAQLYKFRFLPVNYKNIFFVIHSKDAYALKCWNTVVDVSAFDAHIMREQKYIANGPCYEIQKRSTHRDCLNATIIKAAKSRSICFINAKDVKQVSDFYFTMNNKIWFPKNLTIKFTCRNGENSRNVTSNSVLYPKCGCLYRVNGKSVPQTKTCSSEQVFQQIESDYTLINRFSKDPFFLGRVMNSSGGWSESAINRKTEEVLKEAQLVESYFKKKLENEASTSGEFSFRFGLNNLWLLLPLLGVVLLGGVVYVFKCRSNGFSNVPGPMFVNYCNHGENNENVIIRHEGGQKAQLQDRVVSWSAGQRNCANV